jgi:hypothetical protein
MEILMSTSITIRLFLVAVLVALWCISIPTVVNAQGEAPQPLIHACVNSKGAVRIIAPGDACNAKETLVTWPAQLAEPVTFYQRASSSQPVMDGRFTMVVALCDDPADTATGGGFRTDRLEPVYQYTVATSAGCRASGLCAGPTAEDGWIVVATARVSGPPFPMVTAYVVCATPGA